MLKVLRNRRAQSTAEYAILIGLVVAAAITIQTYVKRGIQGRVKDAGDDFYTQFTGSTDWATISTTAANTIASKQFEPGLETTANRSSQSTQDLLQDDEAFTMNTGGTTSKAVTQRSQNALGDFQRYDAP